MGELEAWADVASAVGLKDFELSHFGNALRYWSDSTSPLPTSIFVIFTDEHMYFVRIFLVHDRELNLSYHVLRVLDTS